MTRIDVMKLIAVVKALWPGWSTAPATRAELDDTTTAWTQMLGDIDRQAASGAVEALSAEGREFAPAVGVIRRRALELVDLASGRSAPSAHDGWAEVRSHYGKDGPIKWSHPILAGVVKSIGWQALRLGNEDVVRSNFMKLYAAGLEGYWRERTMTPNVQRIVDQLAISTGNKTELGA